MPGCNVSSQNSEHTLIIQIHDTLPVKCSSVYGCVFFRVPIHISTFSHNAWRCAVVVLVLLSHAAFAHEYVLSFYVRVSYFFLFSACMPDTVRSYIFIIGFPLHLNRQRIMQVDVHESHTQLSIVCN